MREVTFFKFGISSPQQKILNEAKRNLLQHREGFFKQADLIYRAEVFASHLALAGQTNALAVPRIELTPISTSATSSKTDVSWPVYNIQKAFQTFAFVGREDKIEEMHTTFAESTSSSASVDPACCLLSGLGGIGKTSLARQYIHHHKSNYDAIFDIRADSEAELSGSFCQIARKLHLGNEEDSPARLIEEGKNWLEGTSKLKA